MITLRSFFHSLVLAAGMSVGGIGPITLPTVLPLEQVAQAAPKNSEGNTMKTLETYVNANVDKYVRQGIFPIIEAEAVSASKSPQQMQPVAEQVKDIMKNYGLENPQILQVAASYPAVYGEIRSFNPNAPTILIQGHYDGQPSNIAEWTPVQDIHGKDIVVHPHKPVMVEKENEHRIYGRGTSDDWGQVMTHLAAVDAYQKTGTPLPVNLKFLFEGGEEVGSDDMDKLVGKYQSLLQCDAVMITDSAPGRAGHPVITTTTRGLVGVTITLHYGTKSAHSGDDVAPNAVQDLQDLLAMRNPETRHITIPGFYDDVRSYSPAEREKLSMVPFDFELFKSDKSLNRIVTEQGYSPQETMWTRPSFEVHYIQKLIEVTEFEKLTKEQYEVMFPRIPFEQLTKDQYEQQYKQVYEEKNQNNIPYKARAYVTMRLAPNQQPEKIYDLFLKEFKQRAKVRGILPKEIEIQRESLGQTFSTSTDHPFFKAAEEAMTLAFGASVDYMGCGGTEPIAVYYQQILKVPVIFNAYNSPSDNYHAAPESFSIERSFIPGTMANILFYQNVAEVRK